MNDRASGLRNDDQNQENPMYLFTQWLELAENSEPNDPTAMSLASVDQNGMPNV
ncbi:MAG: pyridoxamine 5'-phosphate oxidase, partial [Rhizobiaceae bacterium]|nr:pyridoxamine 5'-phosphate oxidase [Rhizobiaceae bacterium]